VRILLVTFVVPHRHARSGAGVVIHGALTELAAHHDVTLVTFAGETPDEARALDALRTARVVVHEIGGRLPTRIIGWKRRSQRAFARALSRTTPGMNSTDPRLQHLLDGLLKDGDFDLLVVENIGVRHYRYATEKPSLIVEHEAGRVLPRNAQELRRRQPAIWRQFDRIQVYTVSDADAVARIAPDLVERVRVNPFGTEVPKQIGDTQEEAGTVLFVGGFRHWPNVEAALWLGEEIMPVLRSLVSGVRLLIVGNEPPSEVRRLEAEDVVVTGAVPTVEPYLRRAAVIVAPVRSGGGMRVKVLQAMGLGKPVVTTPLGAEGLARAPGDPPVLVAADADALAAATARLLREGGERAALGKRAHTFVREHHSWTAYRQRLEAIHAELLLSSASEEIRR
jgi:polysaccharide biosynthesis protein PslH